MEVMNGSSVGQLLSNFNTLYIRDMACTPAVYNTTYQYYYKSAPSGPFSYANVSQETPQNFKIDITQIGSDTYNVTYTNNAPSSRFDVKIITAEVSTSSFTVESYKFFQGLNLTSFSNAYNFQSAVTGDCGAYITPT